MLSEFHFQIFPFTSAMKYDIIAALITFQSRKISCRTVTKGREVLWHVINLKFTGAFFFFTGTRGKLQPQTEPLVLF